MRSANGRSKPMAACGTSTPSIAIAAFVSFIAVLSQKLGPCVGR